MGFWDRADGNAPGDAPESSEMAALRRKAAQAAQLKMMGVDGGLAGRLSGTSAIGRATDDYLAGYDQDLGYGPEASLGGFTTDPSPLPIIEQVTDVEGEEPGSLLSARASKEPSLANVPQPGEEQGNLVGYASKAPPRTPAILRRFGVPEDVPTGDELIARIGDAEVEAFNTARQLHPLGTLLPELQTNPRTREILGRSAMPSEEAPEQARLAGPATAPVGARSDFSSMSQDDFQRHLATQRMQQGVQEEQDLGAKYARGLQRLEQGPLPGFEYGPPRGLKDIVGREVGGAGLRSGAGVTSGVDAFDRPDGGTTYRSQTDDSIFAVSPRKARPKELAGLRSRAFQTQEYDPADMDVSQATLEHEMAQRAARAALEGGEAETRLRQAQAGAAERDPLGLERLAAQSALDRERYSLANAGRAEASLADDRLRLGQQNARNAQIQEIIQSHVESKRALQEQLALAPPNSPEAALRQQQLADLQEETEMTLAGLGVRLNTN